MRNYQECLCLLVSFIKRAQITRRCVLLKIEANAEQSSRVCERLCSESCLVISVPKAQAYLPGALGPINPASDLSSALPRGLFPVKQCAIY